MTDKITLDRETLKALVVDTRLNVLRLLSEKEYTLTDICDKLSLKGATVKEHLDIMQKAGLISKEETDRKWKYYSLTEKGKEIILPGEKRILFVFGLMLLAAISVELIMTDLMYSLLFPPPLTGSGHPVIPFFSKIAALLTGHYNIAVMFLAVQVLIFVSAFLLGRHMRKPVLIIEGERK